jgi:hypothetical protein
MLLLTLKDLAAASVAGGVSGGIELSVDEAVGIGVGVCVGSVDVASVVVTVFDVGVGVGAASTVAVDAVSTVVVGVGDGSVVVFETAMSAGATAACALSRGQTKPLCCRLLMSSSSWYSYDCEPRSFTDTSCQYSLGTGEKKRHSEPLCSAGTATVAGGTLSERFQSCLTLDEASGHSSPLYEHCWNATREMFWLLAFTSLPSWHSR